MICPFYWGKSMCGVKKQGVFVPPMEMEIKYCKTRIYRKCPRYDESCKNKITKGNNVKKSEKLGS